MRRFHLLVAVALFVVPVSADDPSNREEIEAFMRSAKVLRMKELEGGITRPLRLTLTDGAVIHDAVFQSIDEKKTMFTPTQGAPELNFVDSWRYNIAAYRLTGLLGLDSMIPVTIEYRYDTKKGALSWWLESLMDERTRLKKKVTPPNVTAWNQDMYRMRLFSSLVYDTDRNLGNVLVSPEWRVIMLDFTRAFRLHAEIKGKEIHACDRQLWQRLQQLDEDKVKSAVGEYLTPGEVAAVIKRKDLLVAHIGKLIASQGEEKVLY
jgi:hypothetical protein